MLSLLSSPLSPSCNRHYYNHLSYMRPWMNRSGERAGTQNSDKIHDHKACCHCYHHLDMHAAVDEQIWRDNWNTDSEKSHDHKHVATVRIAIMQQRCHRPRYDHGHLVMMTMVDNNCHNDHWYRHRLYHHLCYHLYHHCHNVIVFTSSSLSPLSPLPSRYRHVIVIVINKHHCHHHHRLKNQDREGKPPDPATANLHRQAA